MPSHKLFAISNTDCELLNILKTVEKDKPEGLTLADIGSSIDGSEKSNLYRYLKKLSNYVLIERKIFKEHTDVRYAITPRGKAYLEAKKLIETYKLEDKKVDEANGKDNDKIVLVEYWAGGDKIHSWSSMVEVIKHWKEAKPIAYQKNFYRFIYANGKQSTVRLEEIEGESKTDKEASSDILLNPPPNS